MGYNGMGYQRWIATLKPRKFLAKRSKPDGGGMENNMGHPIGDYYHLKPNKLENLLKKKISPIYRIKLESDIKEESRRQFRINVVSFIISVLFLIAIIAFLSTKFDLI